MLNEVKSWLTVLLKDEKLKAFSVEIEGNSEKGDGYSGDIVFVTVDGITEAGMNKNYDLVLKCAKKSAQLRKQIPVKESYLNEIFFYEKLFPRFVQFQKEKNVDDPFNKVPKCYGTLIQDDIEILALENVKKKGYILWDKTKALTRKHINLIVQEYAKFHAVSLAMKQQTPREFEELVEQSNNVLFKFFQQTNLTTAVEDTVEEIYNLLQNELEASILEQWKSLKCEVQTIFERNIKKEDFMHVMIHADCWSNNFMHYHDQNDEPSTFVMLDWQGIYYDTPIHDLSYFLFACLSKVDMDDLDTILELYHQTFGRHLRKLGCNNVEELYPYGKFLDEWKKLCRFGIAISTLVHKSSLYEKDDVPDMAETAENGEDISRTFSQPIKNLAAFKERMSYIVEYAAGHNLI